FQESNIVDKRITPRWVNYERVDTALGSVVTVVGAAAIVVTCAFAFAHTRFSGHFTDAGGVAQALGRELGRVGGTLYAVVLLNASIIGAAAVTLGTAYAFGDFFGAHHSLHRSFFQAKGFYANFAGLVALAAAIVLIPHAPLGLITVVVQALAGVLLPSASVFLLLLCNDREVLGPWVNRPWLNGLAALIIGLLLMMSLILVATTVSSAVNVGLLSAALAGALVLALGGAGGHWLARRPRPTGDQEPPGRSGRDTWRMPPLALLGRPPWSRGRALAMWALRVYLVIAVMLLVVKAVELGHLH
ncbi:MAG: NRAMP family divalent metal transporter, partial [Acidimicrobiales bacterium]